MKSHLFPARQPAFAMIFYRRGGRLYAPAPITRVGLVFWTWELTIYRKRRLHD